MISINKKNYKEPLVEVSFCKYSINKNNQKRNGKAIYISYKFDNINLELETVYDKNWLKKLKINNLKDISKYVSDITYKTEKGWISLITGEYKCLINRIDNNTFVFELNCKSEIDNKYYTVLVHENVKIDFEWLNCFYKLWLNKLQNNIFMNILLMK